jgi:hypothetical protein
VDYVFAHGTWWRRDGTHSAPGWTGLSVHEAASLGLPSVAREETRVHVGSDPAPVPSPAAAAPAASSPADALTRIGPGAGPAGLDVGMPETLAAAIVYAWRTQEDPQALRALATTMLQGGYRLAADVLVARAEAKPKPPAPPASSGNAKALGIIAAAVGIVAGLASLKGGRA